MSDVEAEIAPVLEGRARWALVQGDNRYLQTLLPVGAAMLVYADPPFYTQRNFREFDDRWGSLDEYLTNIEDAVVEQFRRLAPEGSLVVHCDQTASHYLKVRLDGALVDAEDIGLVEAAERGRELFASEIVWSYRRWPTPTPNFQKMHDTLLRWRASADVKPRWNQLYEPLSPATIASHGHGRQTAQWDVGKNRVRTKADSDDPSKGMPLRDVWDISIIAASGAERTGYPTQKPVELLERLILSTTNPGDLVVDVTCGSGTTLVAAVKHGRRAIGFDKNPNAIAIARARLSADAPLFDAMGGGSS